MKRWKYIQDLLVQLSIISNFRSHTFGSFCAPDEPSVSLFAYCTRCANTYAFLQPTIFVHTISSYHAARAIKRAMFTSSFVQLPTKIVLFAFKFNYVNHQWSLFCFVYVSLPNVW